MNKQKRKEPTLKEQLQPFHDASQRIIHELIGDNLLPLNSESRIMRIRAVQERIDEIYHQIEMLEYRAYVLRKQKRGLEYENN